MLLLKNKNRVYFYIIAFLFLSTITNNIFLKSFNKIFLINKFIPEYKKLPIIFGQFKIPDFISLQKNLKILNMDNNKITKYYFHKNKRWDLYFENNKIIMLPRQNTENAIKIYNQFISIHKIMPNSIIDLRIPNRIVIKNE